ncbi:MAG TPA: LD-carboxypeptidase [Armatimonadaceae bacterium]|nr:LD-carboxypeptidase [Armatimonadaceae bacterium]
MSSNPPLSSARWPRLLRPGGTIGLVSTSGPSSDESIRRGVAALEGRGYRVAVGENAGRSGGDLYHYLAGDDEGRVADLNRFLNDSDVDLILCARGGYGAARLLDRIDYAAARRDPKPIVGYSDVTALSLAMAARADLVTFSGIMATAGHGFGEETLDPYSEASFWNAVGDGGFPRVFAPPADAAPWTVHRPAPGGAPSVSGPVIPVCLSLLASLVGTPYVPDLTGAVLVIEDVHEEMYAVDRFLTQLRLAGALENLSAILVGSFNGNDKPGEDERLLTGVPDLCLGLAPAHVAVASGIAYGHIPRRMTLPVGARGEVDLGTGTFSFPDT